MEIRVFVALRGCLLCVVFLPRGTIMVSFKKISLKSGHFRECLITNEFNLGFVPPIQFHTYSQRIVSRNGKLKQGKLQWLKDKNISYTPIGEGDYMVEYVEEGPAHVSTWVWQCYKVYQKTAVLSLVNRKIHGKWAHSTVPIAEETLEFLCKEFLNLHS